MWMWFRQFSVAARLRVLVALASLAVLAVASVLLWHSYHREVDDRRTAVQQTVQLGHGLLEWAHAQEATGKLTRAQAQAHALGQLDTLRYGDGEYFWVNDMQARMVHHPIKPALNGQSVRDMQDPNGVYLFREFVDTVSRHGSGFVAYQWPKPGHDVPIDKVSYVQGFAPWGWVIGSGLYIDDLQRAFLRDALIILALVVVATAALWTFGAQMGRDLARGMDEAVGRAEAIAAGRIAAGEADQPFMATEAAAKAREIKVLIQSSTEQVEGGAMTQLDDVTQQNASLVEQSAAAAASLKDQADSLAQVVSRFRVAGAF